VGGLDLLWLLWFYSFVYVVGFSWLCFFYLLLLELLCWFKFVVFVDVGVVGLLRNECFG